MGAATPHDLIGFDALLDAILNSPGRVPEMVRQSPNILLAVNNSAETVLHWLAVENHTEGVLLLHGLGAEVPEFALIHALEMGHVEMVVVLHSLGARLESIGLERVIENPIWQLTEDKKSSFRSIFSVESNPCKPV